MKQSLIGHCDGNTRGKNAGGNMCGRNLVHEISEE